MSSYTITITPDDQSNAVSTVRVEVSPNGTRITELVIRAGDAEGLTPHQFPPVDLELLLRAVNPPARPAATAATATASAAAVAGAPGSVPAAAFSGAVDVTTAPAKIARPRTTAATVAPFTVPTAKPAPATDTPAAAPRNGATTASRPEPAAGAKATAQPAVEKEPAQLPAPAPRAATKRAAVRSTTARTAATRSSAARSTVARPAAAAKPDADTADGGRSYRRAPGDLAEVYRQARSAAGIADHYSVPRHTANNWIRTLKKNNPDT